MPKSKPLPYKLVLIQWIDSALVSAEWTSDEPEKAAQACRSVGWLLHDGEEVKTIAPNVAVEPSLLPSEWPCRAGEMTIPVCAIKKITVLKQ